MNNLLPVRLKAVLVESGVTEDTQLAVSSTLEQFVQKTEEWSKVAEGIVITSPDEVGKMNMAREGRLSLKKTRIECEKLVKERRDVIKARMASDVNEDKLWLKAGQFIETTFKALETKFEEKEKFKEIWEANERKKLKELREKRVEQAPGISKFIPRSTDLSSLTEIDFEALIQSTQKQVEEEDRKEKERIAQDLADKEEKQRLENELKEAKEKLAAIETSIPEAKPEAQTLFPFQEKMVESLGEKNSVFVPPTNDVKFGPGIRSSNSEEIPSPLPPESDHSLLNGYIFRIKEVSLPKLSNPFESSKIEMELVVFTRRLEVLLKDLA